MASPLLAEHPGLQHRLEDLPVSNRLRLNRPTVFRGVVILTAALAVTIVVATVCRTIGAGPSEDEVEARVEEEIPVGATVNEILAWADGEGDDTGILVSSIVGKADDYSLDSEPGLDANTPVLGGIIRVESGFFQPSLQVFFVLDENERFSHVIVQKTFNLP